VRVLLLNPPYVTITSRWGVGHQIPLGLLMVGGSLRAAGHDVALFDAESRRSSVDDVAAEVVRFAPDVVMTGHAGSTPAHPVTMATLRAIRRVSPDVTTVYGGVYPTYRAEAILATEPAVDFIVRGEGEETARKLLAALEDPVPELAAVRGIAYRDELGRTVVTPDAGPIRSLDEYEIAFDLIDDWDRYRCFGLGRAAIVQLSRGCPHRCTYCGQWSFWNRWRHRDPIRVADEIERLHREHDVRFFTIADENPTTLREVFRTFLEELARRALPVKLFATIRATDIVRDADLLDLYRRAGILYVLMGIESTQQRTIEAIDKRSDTAHDEEACRLLARSGIFSILGHIVGLEEESLADFRAASRNLARYGGDHLNAMYATPHPWTPFAAEVGNREIVEDDLARWDYRHQVIANGRLPPWQIFFAVKLLELRFHLRPRRLLSMLRDRDPSRRRQHLWCLKHEALVFLAETFEFLRRTTRRVPRRTVREFLGFAAPRPLRKQVPVAATTRTSPLRPDRIAP
jgi:anaerobic magnesium-protoporphyrin IX monomethyl ester cyclase